jgi:two-component system, chemotaxis family, protein-glutamate methylesterase/glutaminase
MIRVLLVEDSIVQREILRRILGIDDTFTIVGEARNGVEAVRMAEELRPDVVLMDIHMPDMNGVEATREIMRRFPVPIVIVSATLKKRDIDMGLEALHAGAITVLAKPEGAALLNLEKMSTELRAEMVAASKCRLKRHERKPMARSPSPSPAPQLSTVAARPSNIRAIGICSSTGGPTVLVDILSLLPKAFAIPVLLVQHITAGFEETFAVWLGQRTGQPVSVAAEGQRLAPGIWLAASGSHLTLNGTRLLLAAKHPGEIHCPSGNALFTSLARHLGRQAVGILLTGMGDDGALGLLELRNAGGTTIIQDEASSFIWGMPKAGKDLRAASHEFNPQEIGRFMRECWASN